MGILDAVTEYQKRRLSLFFCPFQQILQGNIARTRTVCRHTLVDSAAGELIELRFSYNFYRNLPFFCHLDNFLQAAAFLADIDRVDHGTAAQRFQHRISAGNPILLLCRILFCSTA